MDLTAGAVNSCYHFIISLFTFTFFIISFSLSLVQNNFGLLQMDLAAGAVSSRYHFLSFAYSLFFRFYFHFHLDKIILVFYRWISQLAPWIPVIRQTSRNIESLDWQPVSWSWHRGLEYPNTTYQWYHIHSSKTYEIYKNKETHKHKNLRNNFAKISQILRESIDNQFHPRFWHCLSVTLLLSRWICWNMHISLCRLQPWAISRISLGAKHQPKPPTIHTLFHKLSDLQKCS